MFFPTTSRWPKVVSWPTSRVSGSDGVTITRLPPPPTGPLAAPLAGAPLPLSLGATPLAAGALLWLGLGVAAGEHAVPSTVNATATTAMWRSLAI
jgi:hypothetical protein